jgi:hypothetical protein
LSICRHELQHYVRFCRREKLIESVDVVAMDNVFVAGVRNDANGGVVGQVGQMVVDIALIN